MAIKERIYAVWSKAHLILIFIVCADSAYVKFCVYNKIPQNTVKSSISRVLLYNKPVELYGRLTGTGAGYGFFAPNIKSNGLIIGDCDGEKIMPAFKSSEAAMRFSVLSSTCNDYLLLHVDTTQKSNPLEDDCYNKIFKSIAVKMYYQNNCKQDTFYTSYNFIVFPTLAEYAAGHHDYSLVKTKELRLSIKQR